jgi:hypothetical protein
MSFAVSATASRVVASVRAPVKARNTTVAAFAAPVASKASAAKLAARNATAGVASLRATGASTVARAGRNSVRVLAGRFEAERTYIMIKPDGVQRGYVRAHTHRDRSDLSRVKPFHCADAPLRAEETRSAPRARNASGVFLVKPNPGSAPRVIKSGVRHSTQCGACFFATKRFFFLSVLLGNQPDAPYPQRPI